MKKLLILLMALVMVFGLVGCGEYKPPVDSGSNITGDKNPSTDVNKPGENEEKVFTVTVQCGGDVFAVGQDIKAIWREVDGSAVYTAEFVDGVASIKDLDGDFYVTLSAMPDGYTYDPNINVATNYERDVVIELYKIIETKNTNSTMAGSERWTFNVIESTTGAYRATLKSPNDVVRYIYSTTNYGEYSIQSVADINEDVINPVLDIYSGGIMQGVYLNTRKTYDDGGPSGAYTKNFLYSADLDRGWVIIFCISASALEESLFPLNIDFIIDKDGELTGGSVYEKVIPQEEFKTTPEYTESFKYAATLRSNNILDGSFFALNPEDGYYHFYDSDTDTYGGTLYAKVSKDWTFTATPSGSGFQDSLVSKRFYGKDYTSFIAQYALYANEKDGVYAVTEELKDFLQQFSISQGYFRDGEGWAETDGHYNSAEDDQWLFACGYYIR